MNKIKNFLLLPVIFILFLYYNSCDDSGITIDPALKGRVYLTQVNLKGLDPLVEGVYQLWIAFDTSTGVYFRNAGSFNISQSGVILDSAGSPKVFNLGSDTTKVGFAKYCFICVGGDNQNPVNPRLLAGTFTHYNDSVACNLTLTDTNAEVPALLPVFANSPAWYILRQASNNNINCQRGIWFCDTLGNPYIPNGMNLSASGQWVYEGWMADTSNPSNPVYYSMGKFYNPYAADMDRAGVCSPNPNGGFDKPGQDWELTGGGCPPGGLNLRDGVHQVFITIEPADENSAAQAKPFFLKLFWQNLILVTCSSSSPRDNIFNQNQYGLLPKAHVQIYK